VQVFRYEVVVVGAGLAGAMAALEASRQGRSVVILSKSQPFGSHSVNPESGINLALQKSDDWRRHADDIWNDGHFLSDWDAAEVMCKDGPEMVKKDFYDLLDRDAQGGVKAYDVAGTSRAVKAGENTGLNFMRRAYRLLQEHRVPVAADRVVISLALEGGACRGATVLNAATGELEGYAARSVVLCTGGFGQVYQNTVHGPQMTGDGVALAYQAGVPLKNMEFVRFNQTIIYGTNAAITEGAFLRGMHLYNKHGERFMGKYEPLKFEATDLFHLKRYIQMELDAGTAIEGKYFLADFTHLDATHIDKELPNTRRKCALLGLDILKDPIPVVPGVYVTLGGIAIDVNGATAIPGLYAAGECACPGVHGADWKIGNTVLAALVFGKQAGTSAADWQAEMEEGTVATAVEREEARLNGILARDRGRPYHLLLMELRRAMSKDVAIIRDRSRLSVTLEAIRDLKAQYREAVVWDRGRESNQQLMGFLQLGGMLLVAEAVANAALAREESRGTHWRSDFPERDDANWLRHSLQSYTAGGPQLTHVPVQLGSFVPRESVILR
jgi:succinate dehydrogenase / fumarate reductase flavoprotein subunit